MPLRISTAARNAACDAVVDLIDGGSGAGTIEIRTGSQPANPAAAATGTLLATFTLNDPAFGGAGAGTAGVADLDVTPALTTTGVAAGTAEWFRFKDSSGTAVCDGEVGTAGAHLNLDTTTVSVGLDLSITSGTVTMPES